MARNRTRAQDRKHAQLGIAPELQERGFTKPVLDAMNTAAKERYGLGVGVILQEEKRATEVYRSLRGGFPWPKRVLARSRAKAEVELWEGRLRAVATDVAAQAEQR